MKYWIIMLVLLFSLMLTACNTISGAGQDVQAAGEAVENAAESTEEALEDDD